MNQLILGARLAVIKKNLEQVVDSVNMVEKARSGTGGLCQLLSEGENCVRARVDHIQQQINVSLCYLEGARRRSVWKEVDEARKFLEEAKREAEFIVDKQFEEIRVILESTRTRAVQIGNDRLAETLRDEIWKKAEYSIEEIEKVKKLITNAADAESQGDQTLARQLMEKAWSDTSDLIQKTQPVFADSLDFLGGLALRDTGFDEQVCMMADELITKVERVCSVSGGALTIPAYHEFDSKAFTRSLIRLGYPGWTIWALPLTAHEFGHLVVAQKKALQEFVGNEGASDQSKYHLEDLLADCIGTYMMGPAYPCALALFRLNLSSAYEDREDQPAAAKRAQVVFSMLRRIDDQDINRPYAEIIKDLEAAWFAALEQAGRNGDLGQRTKEQLDLCVRVVGDLLDKIKGLFPPKWAIIQNWPAKLLQNRGMDIQVKGADELREVVNAAWLCRLKREVPLEDIREAADSLWERILAARIKEGSEAPGARTGR